MKKFAVLLSLLALSVASELRAEPSLPILIVSGMKSEADIVRGTGIINVIGAGNATQLRMELQAYNAKNVRAVVSFGIAGGLDPKLQPGDLVIAEKVISIHGTAASDTKMVASLQSILKAAGIATFSGSVYSSDTVEGVDPASRAKIFKQTGAETVDNETHIVAEFAATHGLPFAIVRATGDPASFTLPPAALLPLKPDGTPDDAAIRDSLAKDPGQLGALIELNNDLNAGQSTLKNSQKAVQFGNWLAAVEAGI